MARVGTILVWLGFMLIIFNSKGLSAQTGNEGEIDTVSRITTRMHYLDGTTCTSTLNKSVPEIHPFFGIYSEKMMLLGFSPFRPERLASGIYHMTNKKKPAIYIKPGLGKAKQTGTYSRVVILVRAAAEILRRHHRVAGRDSVLRLPVVQAVACRHVHPAADMLRCIYGEIPIGKSTACSRGGDRRRRAGAGTGTGRVVRIGFGFAGVEVRHEDGVVVETFDVEGRVDGLLDRGGEGVAFVFGAGVDEVEGCV